MVEEYFDCRSDEPDWNPRFNIAPTQPIPVIRQNPKEPVRELSLVRWGLIPSWSKDPSVAARMINARSETAATKPAFRDALKSRRCLIPADGFYEWSRHEAACVIVRRAPLDRTCHPIWQYPTRYGDSVTTRLEALGQCIPPSQDGHRNREGTIFLPASRRIGARVSGRVSRCEPL